MRRGTITVLDDGVECPSLSPDNTRLVYKKRLPDLTWQLWVYDLATKQRTQLAEPGDVDDQAAWLDDRTVAYAKLDESNGQLNVWSVPADGSGAPTLLAENAESPIPLRWSRAQILGSLQTTKRPVSAAALLWSEVPRICGGLRCRSWAAAWRTRTGCWSAGPA